MVKIQTKFILFIIVIHCVTIGLSFLIFKENKLLFIGSEVFILLSLFISWSLYNDLIQPLQLLMTGIDAIRDKDFNVKFVKTGKYEMDALIAVYNTMIDQLRTERTVQQEQHFFLEKLIQNSPIGIIILDFDDKITAVNPRALAFLNKLDTDLIGHPIHLLDNPFCKTIVSLKQNSFATLNTEGVKKFKIQKTTFIDRGFVRSFVMIEDLTWEVLSAEKQVYAKVIRMMAHEVNNSIGAVNSILDTTIELNEASENTNRALQIAFERNAHLSQFMRNFADLIRLPEPRKETIDLQHLVTRVTQLMEFKAKEKNITFLFEPNSMTFNISADVEQMEQVLINIIKNAMEAISDRGSITFKMSANPHLLVIEDTGKGIAPNIEKHLFSPFFTTKAYGQGVGLTLIRDILTNHGFDFSLKTEHLLASGIDKNTEKSKTVFKIFFK